MKPVLLLIVKNPFSGRDFDRMGLEAIEQHFEVRILDCTAWLMPKACEARGRSTMKLPNVIPISSLHEFKDELRASFGGFAIDYVGQFSVRAVLLFHFLKARGFKIIVIDSGAVPPPAVMKRKGFLWKKIAFAVKSKAFQRHANVLFVKLLLKCLPDQVPDYALVSGTSWENNPRFSRAAVKIPAHSFDYEKYLQVRMLPEQRNYDYAVYLDEDLAGHEDNIELGLGHPVSEQRFYGALSRFFDKYEATSGMTVLIASYPSERAGRAEQFKGRKFIRGETAQLIRNAKVVFAHGSTAISYAVLWRRPLVFLTSDELTASWYYSTMEVRAHILSRPVVNIDDGDGWMNLPAWQEIDQRVYSLYEETYIKSKDSPETSLWKIFLKVKSVALMKCNLIQREFPTCKGGGES